ncbi:MAG: metal-dependent hydrolase [Armatimonadetes bacterium]|nr:metal-dependent hydrolase [Armatimonadota bacterium]
MPKLTFIGHACFLVTEGAQRIIIDPFITGNPQAAVKVEEVDVTAILVTHGHGDHLGDAVDLSTRCNATIVGVYELAMYCQKQGAAAHPLHIGGARQFDFGWVKMTPAWHGSAGGDNNEYLGVAAGVLLTVGGKTIYHAGDTGLFGDMKLIGDRHPIDVAILPIGDNFTMGIDDAAEATRMLHPKKVVPCHYNTFSLIEQDPEEFRAQVGTAAECLIMKPGDEVEI